MADKVHKFPCRQCGADLVFNPQAQMLRCEYCGSTQDIPRSEQQIKEYAYNEALAPTIKKGWGTERRSIKCENCGATSSDDPNVTSTRCAFCGSPRVVEQAPREDVIQPESLLPFAHDRRSATESYRRWLSSLWFRPSDLAKESGLASIAGAYIPYWTFDSYTNSFWTAEAGYYYYTTESYTEGGQRKTRQVRHVRWEPASGMHDEFFDDELVYASKGLPERYVKGVEPFDTTKLLAYDPSFLSGWKAEQYSVELKEGWDRGRQSIAEKIRYACAQKVRGDTHRNLRVQTAYSATTYKHVLLPLWIAAFQYGAKTYRVIVNGQTGKASGEAPYSWVKILALVAALILVFILLAKLTG